MDVDGPARYEIVSASRESAQQRAERMSSVSINDKEDKEPVYGPLDLGEGGREEGETSWEIGRAHV